MDKKLKASIKKGQIAKEKKDEEKRKAAEIAHSKHQKYIQSMLPQAQHWIEKVLYKKIAEAEASDHPWRTVYLGSKNVDGIPAKAIYEAAKKIKGLKPSFNCPPIYENAEFVGVGDAVYEIRWDAP